MLLLPQGLPPPPQVTFDMKPLSNLETRLRTQVLLPLTRQQRDWKVQEAGLIEQRDSHRQAGNINQNADSLNMDLLPEFALAGFFTCSPQGYKSPEHRFSDYETRSVERVRNILGDILSTDQFPTTRCEPVFTLGRSIAHALD